VTRTLDEMLAEARAGLDRLSAKQTADALSHGALVVDIRPLEQRRRDGVIPGSLVVDRNVLEWRLAPSSEFRIPQAERENEIVIVCNEGYASSLAAATLQQLGQPRATDLEGGFQAWKAIGLPVIEDPSAQ
jgi:rhodanese-related sulfurtransferase